MVRTVEDNGGRSELHQPAQVQHRNSIGDVADHPKVVGDENVRDSPLGLELHQQVEDGRLDRDVQRRSRFVANNQSRLTGEGTRDCHALLETTGELFWASREIALGKTDRARELEQPCLQRSPGDAGQLLQRAAKNAPHGVAAVQRGVGILKDDLQDADVLLRAQR